MEYSIEGGGATIWKFNPSKSLQNLGGKATYKSNLKVNGKANIKAEKSPKAKIIYILT